MGEEFYDPGSALSVPGLEGTYEYGDVESIIRGRIPNSLLINDLRVYEQIRLSGVDGLHSDPEIRDSRQVNSDRNGETAGAMLYSGRNIGLTGKAMAGSIPAVRDVSEKFSSQFGDQERDLVIHVPRETPLLINEFMFDITSLHWNASGDTFGLVTDGQLEVLEFGAASVTSATSLRAQRESLVDWNGEDIWLYANIKVDVGSTPASEIRLSVRAVYPGSSSSVIVDFQATPVTGTWYELKGRLAATDLDPRTQHVGIDFVLIAGATTAYTVHVRRPAFVLIGEDDPDPVGWFSGELAGFEYEGIKELSRSYGPCYAVNEIDDVDFQFGEEVFGILPDWAVTTATGVTINQQPIQTRGWSGNYTKSAYARATKDNNTTQRSFEISRVDPFLVSSGRTYRWSTRLNIKQIPLTGALVARIIWYDGDEPFNGIDVADSAIVLTTGIVDVVAEGTAPDGAVFAVVSIIHELTSTALSTLEIMWADPSWLDVTDVDQDAFFGDAQYESSRSSIERVEPRRLITRPYLIQRARKSSWSMPDSQANQRYERDFTMGIRASDPRIYSLDERHEQIQLTGTPELFSTQSPAGFKLDDLADSTLDVPTGYTFEGGFTTHPGTGTKFAWTQQATGDNMAVNHPLGGVGLRAWDAIGNSSLNVPAQHLYARVYRSAEGFTYEEPRVIVGGAPSGWGLGGFTPVFEGQLFLGIVEGSVGSLDYYYNSVVALIKRVSSTTWLELRWNSSSKAWSDHASGMAEPNAPYAFELWCSHNASGSLSSTLLATFDYESYDSTSSLYPFRPLFDPMWLDVKLIDNVVTWELWTNYPSQFDFSGRMESGSYELTPSLVTLLGSSVAGHCGWGQRIMKFDQGDFNYLKQYPPYVHYFESSDAGLPPKTLIAPVIGSIDTPQKIEMRGDLVDPIVQITTPSFNGRPGRTSVAKFLGTVSEANPIIIDLYDGSVRDSQGQNRRDLLLPGSDFESFQPGNNYISLQAKSWGDHPAHLMTSWRDALKSG